MVGLPSPEAGQPDPNAFRLEEWLAYRDTAADYVLVEMGHGRAPIALNQSFAGHRAYVGIEAWINDAYEQGSDEVIARLRRERAAENIFFLTHDTGFVEGGYIFGEEAQPFLRGWGMNMPPRSEARKYDPTTILPDGAANEVFLGNVFTDPRIADSVERTGLLLAEASRLAEPGGKVIIRGVKTPRLHRLTGDMMRQVGLKAEAAYLSHMPEHWEAWHMLEQRYHPQGSPFEDGSAPEWSHYFILTKV